MATAAMRLATGCISLLSLAAALPAVSPLPKALVDTFAPSVAGDTIVCAGTLTTGPCETVNAQDRCLTLGPTAFHNVRNIYQAAGTVCKYFDADCSAPRPVVSLDSRKQNLWLDLEQDVGGRIGQVLCRGDWPAMEEHGELNEVDGKTTLAVRGPPVCHWDLARGEYVCGGKVVARSDTGLTASQIPNCYLNLNLGEYVCDSKPITQPATGAIARQFPDCRFDVKLGQYVCKKKVASTQAGPANPRGGPTTIIVCKEQGNGTGCVWLPARDRCQVFLSSWFHTADSIFQEQGGLCHYYENDCSGVAKYEFNAKDSPAPFKGPELKKLGAVKCELSPKKLSIESAKLPTGIELATTTNSSVKDWYPAMTLEICNEQEGAKACLWLPWRECQILPAGFFHAAGTVVLQQGFLCRFYDSSCMDAMLYEAKTTDSAMEFSGAGISSWGAVQCSPLS